MIHGFAILAASLLASPASDYRLPLELGGGGPRPYVTAYRDLEPGGGLLDHGCGRNTYNGHRGTDLGIGGFAAMDAGSRWVVAASDGVVTFAQDGCFDRCTSGACDCGAGFGNYVKVTHADGKSTFYGHLMRGTVQVALRAEVRCGQRLGKVGSSGNSTGPHLHFEPRYASNTSDDPFSGPCGGPTSWWVEQGVYDDLPGDRCAGGAPPPPPPPVTGILRGAVFDADVTPGPADEGNVRLPAAMVSVDGGAPVAVAAGDAAFRFELSPGPHTYEARAPGYAPNVRTVEVRGGETIWGSIGLRAEAQPPEPPPPEVPAPRDGEPTAMAPPAVDPGRLAPVPGSPAEIQADEPGGCQAGPAPSGYAILALLAFARRSRRRV